MQCDNITFRRLPSALRVTLYPTMQRSQLDLSFAVTNAQELIQHSAQNWVKNAKQPRWQQDSLPIMRSCENVAPYSLHTKCLWLHTVSHTVFDRMLYMWVFYPKWQIRKIQAESTNPRDETGIPNARVETSMPSWT